MKILVFADSHKDVETMIKVAEYEKADVICHCGDHLSDALELEKYIDVPLYCIAGNADEVEADLYEKRVTICGKRFLLTHGTEMGAHGRDIMKFFDGLCLYDTADIILFGHSHEPFINGFFYDEGNNCFVRKWLFNPGSIKPVTWVHCKESGQWHEHKVTSSYGLIHLDENTDDIRCEIVKVPEHLKEV